MIVFEQLKEVIRQHLRSKVPGMYQLLDFLSNLHYRINCIDLLFSSPSKLYLLVLQYYKGDSATGDIVFQMLFLNPIASYIRRPDLIRMLMDHVKLGRDTEFIEIVKSSLPISR